MLPSMLRRLHLAALLSLPFALACESSEHDDLEGPVEIAFEARVADLPFACGQDYTGLGSDGAGGTPQDFRFYVHDVRLVTVDGDEYPVTLADDGEFQGGGVALLDFEDGTGACKNGTPERHTTLKGTVAPQPRHGGHGFAGVRFKIGVPQDLNHQDLTTQPAPLNDTTMSWTWNLGHIFFSAWGLFGTDPYALGVHLGSTGCTGDAMAGEIVSCTNPNRPEIALAGFDPDSSTIIVDWGAMFSGFALATPSAECEQSDGETSCACHSFGPEQLCQDLFTPLGLDWDSGAGAGAQALFRVQ